MHQIRIASRSEVGSRQANEDDLRHGSATIGWYAVIADGAGGHRRGAEAAQRAVTCVETVLQHPSVVFSPDSLTMAVQAAHATVQRHQDSDLPDARMHCTIVALWIDTLAHYALWSHVGDSRLYRIRRGTPDLVTADDSVVQRMVRAGLITAQQASNHPQKNQLLAALGIEGEIDAHTVARPVELHDGDAFLLCTDGWWEPLSALTVATTLAESASPEQWLDRMGQLIRERANPKQDNYSAIAVWVGDPTDITRLQNDDTVPRMRALGD